MLKPLNKKIFTVVGEVSGDVLGSEIMRISPKNFKFVGVGGSQMQSHGLKTLFPISDLAAMGIFDVIKKAKTLTSRINTIVDAIIREQPDIVLTIDSSSLATQVIKKVKRAGVKTKFYHVVAPMVWVWGSWRAKKYAKFFDKLFCFFDFEKPYFTKYGLDTTIIGMPIYSVVHRNLDESKTKKYFTMLPGSRMGEVSKIMDVYRDLAARLPEYTFAIPVAETTKKFIEQHVKSWKEKPKLVPFNKRYELFNETKMAISMIGTATAELAIMHIPAVVVSTLGFVAKLFVRTKYLSLPNIVAGKGIYPELNDKEVTVENILKIIRDWDTKKMANDLKIVDKLWHKQHEPMQIVVDELSR